MNERMSSRGGMVRRLRHYLAAVYSSSRVGKQVGTGGGGDELFTSETIAPRGGDGLVGVANNYTRAERRVH